MEEYRYITLMEKPELKEEAASWFHSKWCVPKEAYLECKNVYSSLIIYSHLSGSWLELNNVNR